MSPISTYLAFPICYQHAHETSTFNKKIDKVFSVVISSQKMTTLYSTVYEIRSNMISPHFGFAFSH